MNDQAEPLQNMKEPKKLGYFTGLATGLVLGVLANSIEVKVSEPFEFCNPVGLNCSAEQIEDVVKREPVMRDTQHSLDLFGIKIPLVTYREIRENGIPYHGKLDSKGNIQTENGVFELHSAHDSRWYTWKQI